MAKSRVNRQLKLAFTQWFIGLTMTLLALAAWMLGPLDRLEQIALQTRAQWFGSFSPGPSDKIFVIAIDQAALDNIGRWPWSRQDVAEIIHELSLAGVKVVALDLLLEDPDPPRWTVRRPDLVERDPKEAGVVAIDGDGLMAMAIREYRQAHPAGGVVLASAFAFSQRAMDNEEGVSATPGRGGAVPAKVSGLFRVSLADVAQEVRRTPELLKMPVSEAQQELMRRLFPPSLKGVTKGPEAQQIVSRFGGVRVLSQHAASSSVPAKGVVDVERYALSLQPSTPVPLLGLAATRLGNVSFNSYDSDGSTRRVPLWVQHDGRLWPNLGLTAATLYLGTDLAKVRLEGHETVIPTPDGERRLHVYSSRVNTGEYAGLHFITWPRPLLGKPVSDSEANGWQWQFYDTKSNSPREVPIGRVFEPIRIARRMSESLENVRLIVRAALVSGATTGHGLDERGGLLIKSDEEEVLGAIELLTGNPFDAAVWGEMFPMIKVKLDVAVALATRELLAIAPRGTDLAALAPPVRQRAEVLAKAIEALDGNIKGVGDGFGRIAQQRAELKRRLDDSLCFVGWTATGALADFVSTNIDPKTPGVHIHAAIANTVLTGYQKRPASEALNITLVVLLGVLGTFLGVRASVIAGPVICFVLLVAWFGVAGFVFWDWQSIIVPFSGPATALALSVLGIFVHRLFIEQAARRRTEERFKSRVAPQVVDILVNNPDLDTMKPQRRELSVMFTDLASFTTTAERLGEQKTAEVLASFLGTMTDIVLARGATFDKYIGDAIVAFWGAPVENPYHAADGCAAALQMMHKLDEMNAAGVFADVGPKGLTMRAGLSAGEVMVGDFGAPPKNSSYTTLGDTTNLASRLEGANKVFGSRILVSERFKVLAEQHTAALKALGTQRKADKARVIPALRWRTLGRVIVKGKKESIPVYELVGDLQPWGERTDAWITLTESLVGAYQRGEFDRCDQLILEYQQQFGDAPLLDLYRDAMIEWSARVDRETAFDGSVELREK